MSILIKGMEMPEKTEKAIINSNAKTVKYVELSQETIDKIADAVVRRIKDERTD